MSPFAFPFVWERRESKRNWYNMLFCNLLRVQLSIYLKISSSLYCRWWWLYSATWVQIWVMCSKNQDVLHVSRIWIFKYSDLEFENSKSWRVDEEFWWKYQNCLFRSIEMKILFLLNFCWNELETEIQSFIIIDLSQKSKLEIPKFKWNQN